MIALHMSDALLAAATEAIGGVPTELLRRSAQARAQAQGVSLDEVLRSWTGGAPMPATARAPVETAPVEVAATPEPEPVAPPAAAEPAAEAAPVPVATAVQVLEPAVALEPAPLGDRVRFAAGIGAVIGLLLGVVLALAASPLVVDRATVIGEDPYRAGVEVKLTWFIILTAIASAVFGALIASASRLMPAWFHPEMMLRGSVRATSSMGAIIGAVFGTIGAALTSGLVGETVEAGAGGVPGETVPTAVVLSVGGTFVALLIGGAILGALVAAVVQLLGEPAVLPADVEAEAKVVKRRLVGSVLIPVAGLAAIALIVLPLALLFLEFPGGCHRTGNRRFGRDPDLRVSGRLPAGSAHHPG